MSAKMRVHLGTINGS
ncbi:hypothetical protein MTR67_048918 [Solanum verrucosum]|uniref:Uncharacterized protein n=1 Tax=Solanum verrucosum TaxID=315347 RepID=A0AAF0ZZR3_SOLVR|nr:hypothetical protein MTR67_048918 [Solanum verrucosum]